MTPRRRLRRRCALAMLALLWTSCTRTPSPPASRPASATTQAGPAAELHDWVLDPPVVDNERDTACPRLLSAAPRVTEICCALGRIDHLVGRTRYCVYPPAVQRVPAIGALNDLNVEALLEIKPDLILVSGHSRAISDRLTRLGLRYESLPDTSLDDLFTTIRRTGHLTGREDTARRLIAGLRADLDTVVARYVKVPKTRVLLLTDPLPDPPTQADTAGPGSFYDDLLRLAGHTNVAEPMGRPFGPVGLEFILQADPDVIVELAPDASSRRGGDADALRVWQKIGPLRALAGRRVHVLAGPEYSVLGPRIALLLDALLRTIAGDVHE